MAGSETFTASLRTVRPLVAGLTARGIDVAEALRNRGVDPAWMHDPDARVAASLVHGLWESSGTLARDPAFGLRTAMGIRPGSFDVLDYVCRNCATVMAGLTLYCRFTPLLHDGIRASLEVVPGEVRLRHTLADGSVLPQQYAEFIIASLVVIARQASDHLVMPRSVSFIHPRPSDISVHRALFGCPVRFGEDANGFVLDRRDAERPLVGAEPGLLAILERHATDLLAKHPRPEGFAARVRATILAVLRSGDIRIREVARRLGVGERTVRRRLEAAGTSYQRLLTEVRTELAARYMDDRSLSTDEVALLLGFSDRTAFTRAFRQWTGFAPTEYRRRLAQQTPSAS